MKSNVTDRRIKCAHCKDYHETVAQVRLCSEKHARLKRLEDAAVASPHPAGEGPEYTAAIQERERQEDEAVYAAKAARDEAQRLLDGPLDEELDAKARLDAMTGAPGRDMASPKQVAYVIDLLREHEWPDALAAADVENMERRQVSKLIDALVASPRKSREDQPSPVPEVPAGRYAILEARGGPQENDHVLRFYQVDRPTDGTWAGRTFVKQLIGAPGDWRKEPVRGMRMARVLNAILVNPEEAAIRYGKESKECGVCHSPLSTKASRVRGIGPKCASKTGWGA